jgi:hypothetical protein
LLFQHKQKTKILKLEEKRASFQVAGNETESVKMERRIAYKQVKKSQVAFVPVA